MLFQDGALFDDMTVGENVAFPMRQHTKWSEHRDPRERRPTTSKRVGLPGAADKMPSELSGGMRKRAAFARAIALRPDIVLCDEPSSGLDPVMSATLDDLILELHDTLGMTFVVISHDTAEARKIATISAAISRLLAGVRAERGDIEVEAGISANFSPGNTRGPIEVL
jgi:phospholipid/cholesterol/gamma-HCH transport system ATP-binding protein